MNMGIGDAAELAQLIAAGRAQDYGAKRHREGAETIAVTERARKVLVAKDWLRRGFVYGALGMASYVPALARWQGRAAVEI